MEREKGPAKSELPAELPTTSPDWTCRYYLEEIQRLGRMGDVRDWIKNALDEDADMYDSVQEFLSANPGYEENLDETLSPDEKTAVRAYSGRSFSWINSIARGFWDYEQLGKKTPELEEETKETTRRIVSAIDKAPKPKKGFITFRGTNLDAFRNYGITELSELEKMKGQFMLEQGFTSTSLVRDKSFAERKVSDLWIKSSSIETRYRIPAGSDGIIAMTSGDLSYNDSTELEVLIRYGALSYVTDVSYGEDGHPILDMVLIPNSVYDHP